MRISSSESSLLPREFKASLGCVRTCQRKRKDLPSSVTDKVYNSKLEKSVKMAFLLWEKAPVLRLSVLYREGLGPTV